MYKTAILLLLAALAATGCGSGPCGNVCQKWADCVGTPTDGVDGCTNECNAKADSDAVYRGHVENCDTCSAPLVCSEAAKNCAVDCAISVAH